MSRKEKRLKRLLGQPSDLRFAELESVLLQAGYVRDRTRGSHAVYVKNGYPTLTIPVRSPVKSYLIKQVLAAIEDLLDDV